jgi:hypothetical protein
MVEIEIIEQIKKLKDEMKFDDEYIKQLGYTEEDLKEYYRIESEEKEQKEEQETEIIEGYILSEEESEEEGDGEYGEESESEKLEEEFQDFEEKDPDQEYQIGYAQLTHTTFGDIELGGVIGGKYSKIERLVKYETISKEKLFINELRSELTDKEINNYKIQNYIDIVKKITRYWLKNIDTIVYTILLIEELEDTELNKKIVDKYSKNYGIGQYDIIRYYRLLKNLI